jgi:hypothetical protein
VSSRVEVLPHLDLEALRHAEPTWFVGFSDISTLLLALTTVDRRGDRPRQNLLETPYEVPHPLAHWLDVVSAAAGGDRGAGRGDGAPAARLRPVAGRPDHHRYTFDSGGRWSPARPGAGPVRVEGRLSGAASRPCRSSPARGTATCRPSRASTRRRACSSTSRRRVTSRPTSRATCGGCACRAGSTRATPCSSRGRRRPDADGFTQLDAVRSVLGDLGLPVVLDVDCGHVSPHLALVNGALAELEVDGDVQRLTQMLV